MLKDDLCYTYAAIIIAICLLFMIRFIIKNKYSVSKEFVCMLLAIIISSVAEIVGECYFSGFMHSEILCLWGETLFIVCNSVTYYCVFLMVTGRVEKSAFVNKMRNGMFFLLIFTWSILIVNLSTRFIFDVSKTNYIFSAWMYGVYGISFLVPISLVVIISLNRRKLDKKIIVASYCSFIFPIIAILLQMFVSQYILLIPFGEALTALIFMFTLETPDTGKLDEAIEELSRLKHIEEESRKAAEMSDNVKTLFLSSVTNELQRPITSIIDNAKEIMDITDNHNTSENANEIKNAGLKLQKLVREIVSGGEKV